MAWIYKLRVCLITTVAATLIVFAVAFSVLRALLPHAEGYVGEVENRLSAETGLPVSIGSIDADMHWLTPRLKLLDVVVYDRQGESELFRLDEANFALAYFESLINLWPQVGDISLVGTELHIERHPDDLWVIQGFEFQGGGIGESPQELINFVENTNFSLLDSDIYWNDHVNQTGQMKFAGVNVVLESFFDERNLEADMRLPQGYGETLRVIAKVNGNIGNLRNERWELYLEGAALNIQRIMEKLKIPDVPPVKGVFDGSAWMTIDKREAVNVIADFSLQQAELTSTTTPAASWQAESIQGKLRWQRLHKGWRLDVKDLLLAREKSVWVRPSAISAIYNDNSGLQLSASYLRAQDIDSLAGLFVDESSVPQMSTLSEMAVSGDFYNVRVSLPADANRDPDLEATFHDLSFVLPGEDITVTGMDGSFAYRQDALRLELLTKLFEIDFGGLFRQPIKVDVLSGTFTADRHEQGWLLTAPDVYLLNMDIEANTRLRLDVLDSGITFADVQTDFRNAIGAAVSRYLPTAIMSTGVVEWLDMAITDGLVETGSFLLHGELGQFPYAGHEGVMQVMFGVSNASLKFDESWPLITDLSADVLFENSSMFIENGSGKSFRGLIDGATATIADLDDAVLHVGGHVSTVAEDAQQYIWHSNLNDVLGAAMNQFQAEGQLDIELSLEMPLKNVSESRVNGELVFSDNELYFPLMQYTLDKLDGKLLFTETGLSAREIAGHFEGSPVKINIDTIDQGPRPETVFRMRGVLPADRLLRRFSWISDDWFAGASDWVVAMHVPKEIKEYAFKVEMQSALEGVEINLSDRLAKNRDDVLLIEVDVSVLDDALQLEVESDQVLSVFATKSPEGKWDFVVDSDVIRGSGHFEEDFNTASTIELELERVDFPAIFHSSNRSLDDVSIRPSLIPSLNITARNLLWKDLVFSDIRLNTSWHSHGMLVNEFQLDSPSLKVSGKGSWLSSWRHEHESTFNFSVSSDNLGNALSTLGITNSLARCEHVASVNWKWLAEPYRFSLNKVSGSAHIEMSDGVIKDVKPGAGGRLMGLFNVYKLGDRLMLNFSDVYKDGFAFDTVTGDFEFDHGDAVTNNLELNAAAADVRMLGRVGLEKQDYDLEMQVRPHSSAVAFTGGTLAAGPVIGTALVVVNKLLGLDELAYDVYKVTGSWDEPQVKLVSKREYSEQAQQDDDEDEN